MATDHKTNPENHPIINYVWELEARVRELQVELAKDRTTRVWHGLAWVCYCCLWLAVGLIIGYFVLVPLLRG